MQSIVAFLGTLTDDALAKDPVYSDPFKTPRVQLRAIPRHSAPLCRIVRRMHSAGCPVTFAVTLALVLWFRFFVVRTWHAPAGDGVDFYQLSQSLLLQGRFAVRTAAAWPAVTVGCRATRCFGLCRGAPGAAGSAEPCRARYAGQRADQPGDGVCCF